MLRCRPILLAAFTVQPFLVCVSAEDPAYLPVSVLVATRDSITFSDSYVPPPQSTFDPYANPNTVSGGFGLPASGPPGSQQSNLPFSSPSSLYFRTDYFHWNEVIPGFPRNVNEDGLLLTLGYQKRCGFNRGRGEVFGGSMDYKGGATFNEIFETVDSKTDYFGLRGELERLIEYPSSPEARAFAGIGTRWWIRQSRDAMSPSGHLAPSVREYWLTFYPYAGVEASLLVGSATELYFMTRVGLTLFTYERAEYSTDTFTANPKPAPLVSGEVGLRRSQFSLTAFFDWMKWAQSDPAPPMQPESTMLTAGLKLTLAF